MLQTNTFLKNIKSFCDFYIEFDSTNQTYLFNNKYIDEIDCQDFSDSIISLQNNLIDALSTIKKPQNFIKEILCEIEKTALWYENESINDFKNFNKLSRIIVNTEGNRINNSSSNFTLEQIQNCPDDTLSPSDEMFYYLIIHKSKTQNYQSADDFEKVKLHYIVTKYFASIYSLIEYLLMLDELEEKYGIDDYNQFRPIPKPHLKCNINLSKIEVANLFHAFFETGYFYLDIKNERHYRKAKYDFIENNFNYINQHGKLSNIGNIIKEFGEIESFSHAENQVKVIQSLIDKLTEIQNAIKLDPKTKIKNIR